MPDIGDTNDVGEYLLAKGSAYLCEFGLWFEEAIEKAFVLGLEPVSLECNRFVEEVLVTVEEEEIESDCPGSCFGTLLAWGTEYEKDYEDDLKAEYKKLVARLSIGEYNFHFGKELIWLRTDERVLCVPGIEAYCKKTGASYDDVEAILEDKCMDFHRFDDLGVAVCWEKSMPAVFCEQEAIPAIGSTDFRDLKLVAILRDGKTPEISDWLKTLLEKAERFCGSPIPPESLAGVLRFLDLREETVTIPGEGPVTLFRVSSQNSWEVEQRVKDVPDYLKGTYDLGDPFEDFF